MSHHSQVILAWHLFLAEMLGPLSWESARPLTSQSLATQGKSVLLDPWHRKWELIPISSVDPLKPKWSSLPQLEAMSTLYLLETKYCCLYKCECMPREGMLFVQGHTVFLQELLGFGGPGQYRHARSPGFSGSFLFSSCDSNSFLHTGTYSMLVCILTFDLLGASRGAQASHGGGGFDGVTSLFIFS